MLYTSPFEYVETNIQKKRLPAKSHIVMGRVKKRIQTLAKDANGNEKSDHHHTHMETEGERESTMETMLYYKTLKSGNILVCV